MAFVFPRIYPILDSSFLPASGRKQFLSDLGASLADAGVTLLEYRHKTGADAELTADAEALRLAMPEEQVRLILDDRADLVCGVGFDGVHVDAGDVSVREARRIVGPGRMVGTFAGSDKLLPGILDEPANYFAIGQAADRRGGCAQAARGGGRRCGADGSCWDHAGDGAGGAGCGSKCGGCGRGDFRDGGSGGGVSEVDGEARVRA